MIEEEQSLLTKMKRIFSGNKDEQDDVTEEIISMIDEGHEQGVFAESEAKMLRNIFEFAQKDARDIMTHRKNIVAIDGDDTLEEALLFILEQKYSRFPVFDEEIDNIIGTMHMRDVMKCYMNESLRKRSVKELDQLNREVTFIPETKNIDSLFKKMQSEKNHMAVVIDEYGQTKGLVAMEDILEEIVGNILDEYDEDEEFIIKQADDSFLAKGMHPLDELEELLEIEFEKDEFDTLNGFLISCLDHIPAAKEHAKVEYRGFIFRVLSVENNMIETIHISKAEG